MPAASALGQPSAPGSDVAPTSRPAGPELSLAPTLGTARRYGIGSVEGPGGGTTLRRSDAPPHPGLERAAEENLVTERINTLLADSQAQSRVEQGRIDDYFHDLRVALEKGAGHPPQFKSVTNPVAGAVRNYVGGMRRFGATGNPYRQGPRGSARDEPGPHQRNGGALLSRYQDFFEGRFGSDIVALVEIQQAGDGSLLSSKLVASSGLPEFDVYVMGSVPSAITPMNPPPKQGAGIHADGILSLWAFEGLIVYAQPLVGSRGETNLLNAPYLVFGGKFEETTGEIWVNKIDEPQFRCRVHLLRVY